MAVRSFDLRESSTDLSTFPRSRAVRRRERQRFALIGAVALVVPFVGALVALGVAH